MKIYKLNFFVCLDFNNSLAHTCCASGQAECLNCCIQHNVDINTLNLNSESPLDVARKVGKGLHVEKASE